MTDTTTTAPPPPTKEEVVTALKKLKIELASFPGPKPNLDKWLATLQEAVDYIDPPKKK